MARLFSIGGAFGEKTSLLSPQRSGGGLTDVAFARRGKHALEIQRFTHSMSADIVFDATSGEGHFGYLSPSKHGSPFEQMAPCTLVNQIAHFKRCRSWEQFRRQTSTHCRGYIARWHPCRLCIHVYIYIYTHNYGTS